MVTSPKTQTLAIWLLALAISWCITFTNQVWVGGETIYSAEREAARERLHGMVLSNRLDEGVSSWNEVGGNGMNVRRLTVWLAEGLRRGTGRPLNQCYWVIETGALFACCLLLFAFVRSCGGTGVAFAALLYYGSVLPLTYLFHYFHPWDKPGLASWLAALIAAKHRRWWVLALVLAVGMFIKYDVIVFPLVVLLANWRRIGWRKSLLLAGTLGLLVMSIYLLLRWLAPGGFEPRPWLSQITQNLRLIRSEFAAYPPFLALGVPAALAAVGYRQADDFARACALTAGVIAVLLFVQVNFVEFRTEVAILVLLLPAAATGVLRVLGDGAGIVSRRI